MGVLQAALTTPGSEAHPCSGASCSEETHREPILGPYRYATLTAKHRNAIQASIETSLKFLKLTDSESDAGALLKDVTVDGSRRVRTLLTVFTELLNF
ncbi:hypothetical protein MHYP_G00201470 [Metynnis hypsauchen]